MLSYLKIFVSSAFSTFLSASPVRLSVPPPRTCDSCFHKSETGELRKGFICHRRKVRCCQSLCPFHGCQHGRSWHSPSSFQITPSSCSVPPLGSALLGVLSSHSWSLGRPRLWFLGPTALGPLLLQRPHASLLVAAAGQSLPGPSLACSLPASPPAALMGQTFCLMTAGFVNKL